MEKLIHFNDIAVLSKIFNPKGEQIFIRNAENEAPTIPDTLDCTCRFFSNSKDLIHLLPASKNQVSTIINLTNQTLNSSTAAFNTSVCISISKPINIPSTHKIWKFDYINNPDGTIRWIYNTQQTKPLFLNLYNASGWRGSLFKNLFKLGFLLNLKSIIKAGSFWVSAKSLDIEEIALQLKNAKYAIFTGTTGENRKAVLCFEERSKPTQFVKMPLTKQAKGLIQTEKYYLEYLATLPLDRLVPPQAKEIGANLMVSNIRPIAYRKKNNFINTHLLALHELYEGTTKISAFMDLKAWKEIQQNLLLIKNTVLVNDLSQEKTTYLGELLEDLYGQFDPFETFPVAIAHGDFTPWNSYTTKDKVYLYDWELAEELPLLYDAFHYIFQTGILVKQLPFSYLQKEVNRFREHASTQLLLGKFKVDFDQSYRFYLLRNTSYYLIRYMQQAHLHKQAHWLVDTWIVALEQVTSNNIKFSTLKSTSLSR